MPHGVGNPGDCFLLLKNVLPLAELNVITDENGRFILVDCVVYSWEFRVTCVYVLSSVLDRERFFSNALPYLETDSNVVLVGGFNCIHAGPPIERGLGFM